MYVIVKPEGTGPLVTLALCATFTERSEAEAAAEPGQLVATWYGGKDEEGRPIWGSQQWGPREPVTMGTLLLPLPEAGTGCRSEHDGLLSEAARWIGSGLPLDALTREGDDYEAWEVDEDEAGRVVAVCVRWNGTDSRWVPDEEDTADGEDWPKGISVAKLCREAADWATNEHGTNAEDEDPHGFEHAEAVTVYAVLDEDGDVSDCYDNEGDAEDAVTELQDQQRENRYGYPWAWNWAYYIDEDRAEVLADLKAAGFTVAKQTESGHTFCGIDGGGYDFKSSHHVVFAALRLASYGGTVPVSVRQDGEAAPAVDCIPVGPVRRIGGAS